MPEDVPHVPIQEMTEAQRKSLIDTWTKRYEWSKSYFSPWHERWVRYYKIWRNLVEVVESYEDEDEPNSFVPYAFGIVEDICAGMTEAMFRLKPPAKVSPIMDQDQESADNFSTMARTYFSTAKYRRTFTRGAKERVITGNQWERYEYANQWSEGKRWAKIKRPAMVQTAIEIMGKMFPVAVRKLVTAWELVEQFYPRRVGYQTVRVSVFHVHPQPNVPDFDDIKWLVEEDPAVPVDDLREKHFTDPNTGEKRPAYYLDELLREEKGGPNGTKTIAPRDSVEGKDYWRESMEVFGSASRQKGLGTQDDGIDKVHIMRGYSDRGEIVTIAQGKYIIGREFNPVGQITWGHRTYTDDPQFIMGIGAIEPIEDQVYDLNDTGNLARANWLRIVNGMIAVNVDNLVDESDLQPRAGMRVRVTGSQSARDVISSVSLTDVTPSMLAMDSYNKGIMEKATANADLAPGVSGTKQEHDTATGVLEIQRNMAKRRAMNIRADLAAYQRQMWFMEKIMSFFQFDEAPFSHYGPDGNTSVVMLNNESIYTDGRGFEFLIEDDPSYGDDNVRLNLRMKMLEILLRYEEWRVNLGKPTDSQANLPEIVKLIARDLGFENTSSALRAPDGVLDPKQEIAIMVSGGSVKVNPRENIAGHLIEHIQQRQAPEFLQAVESGKIAPEIVATLDRHIEETLQALRMIAEDPQKFALADQQSKSLESARRPVEA